MDYLLGILTYSEWYSGWCMAKLQVLSRDKIVIYEVNFVYALHCLVYLPCLFAMTYCAYDFECSSFSLITEIMVLGCRSHELRKN